MFANHELIKNLHSNRDVNMHFITITERSLAMGIRINSHMFKINAEISSVADPGFDLGWTLSTEGGGHF